jgi:hypothetical protein
MCFDSFFSGGFTTMAVINPPEKKLAKRTSVCISGVVILFFLREISLPEFGFFWK